MPSAPADPSPTFRVKSSVRRADRMARRLIYTGGVGVILTVSGLFFFLFLEILPLFKSASVGPPLTFSTGVEDPLLLGVSPDSQAAFILSERGRIHPLPLTPRPQGKSFPEGIALPEGKLSTATWFQDRQLLLLATEDGTVHIGRATFNPAAQEAPLLEFGWEPSISLTSAPGPIRHIDMAGQQELQTITGLTHSSDGAEVAVASRRLSTTPFASNLGPIIQRGSLPLHGEAPVTAWVGPFGDMIMTLTERGAVLVHRLEGDTWQPAQTFDPFPEGDRRVLTLHPLQGRQAYYLTDTKGGHHLASLIPDGSGAGRALALIASLPDADSPLQAFSASPKNKALFVATNDSLELRYGTTRKIRWRQPTAARYADIRIHSLYDGLSLLDRNGELTVFPLNDPHPESSWTTTFGKVWYEGYEAPAYVWQSTGGSDTHEPKLSLVPLLVGSFKGTLFALFFSIPIALLAAVYTSQFLHPTLRSLVKPIVELMASLPSVVLGFIAALWLGPLLEKQVPALILVAIAIPASAIATGLAWQKCPMWLRGRVPDGLEFILVAPAVVLSALVAWQAGPLLEAALFHVQDPLTGAVTADFRLWWETHTDGAFQQRNALIIGLVMGFAIIPIIYTIAEDALSAVPQSLVSGSLALGANSWQTTFNIVIPTASAGIFSAIIIGTGRAIGETMILLMASGNTPILDGDLFSGMRTLAANIAIELPEAAVDSTLYRTLFLGAMVLFILTFFFNSLAEMLRERLRRKYRIIE